MPRRRFTNGIALVTAGGLFLGGGVACSHGSEVGTKTFATASPKTYEPPQPTQEPVNFPPCHIGIKWLTANSIHLTLSEPADVAGMIMNMTDQWGNGSGSEANASSVNSNTGEFTAAPITPDGQPVNVGDETYKAGTYAVLGELGILEAGQSGSSSCSQVIRVPHEMNHISSVGSVARG